jgi:putative acetyltransferase
MSIIVRLAEPRDYASTRRLVDDAFRPEDVVTFLDAMRADVCILDEWVAESDGEIIGHIVFSRVWVERPDGVLLDAAMLTPLAVKPSRQRQGVGLSLMNHALASLEARGEHLFFVLGHPLYYPRAGFQSAPAEQVASPWQGQAAFMMRGASVPAGRLIMPRVIAEAH